MCDRSTTAPRPRPGRLCHIHQGQLAQAERVWMQLGRRLCPRPTHARPLEQPLSACESPLTRLNAASDPYLDANWK